MGCKLSKSFGIITLILFKESYNSFELVILKLLINVFQVLPSISPVLYFIQRSRVFIFMMRVRIWDNFLDLTVPLNDYGFKPFDEVFVLAISKRKVFFWNVEFSVSFFLIADFCDWDHEFVELSKELFFNIIRPWAFIHDGGNEDRIHENEETFEFIFLD